MKARWKAAFPLIAGAVVFAGGGILYWLKPFPFVMNGGTNRISNPEHATVVGTSSDQVHLLALVFISIGLFLAAVAHRVITGK